VGMDELDRVLDGENVPARALIAVVDQGGQCGRLAGSGGPGHEHEPARLHGERPQRLGKPELLESRQIDADAPGDEPDLAALTIDAQAETPHAGQRARGAQLVRAIELLGLRVGERGAHDGLDVLGVEHVAHRGHEVAVDAQKRRGIGCEIEIGAAALLELDEEFVESHAWPPTFRTSLASWPARRRRQPPRSGSRLAWRPRSGAARDAAVRPARSPPRCPAPRARTGAGWTSGAGPLRAAAWRP